MMNLVVLLIVLATSVSANNCTNSGAHCSGRGHCYFGECFCWPSYKGAQCEERFEPANPYYTKDCPNLLTDVTFDKKVGAEGISKGKDCFPPSNSGPHSDLPYCAYLCYSHPEYGVAMIPEYIWHKAQSAEQVVWNNNYGTNDRSGDHFEGFENYAKIPQDYDLGDMVEIGAGPWTQARGLYHKRPDLKVNSFTIVEPGADEYIKSTPKCAYKTGKLQNFAGNGYHDFPITIYSSGAAERGPDSRLKKYDSLIVINVIEHVQDAFAFLTRIYHEIKVGGMLIFHERYYTDVLIGDKVLGHNVLHPIRLYRKVFDKFLDNFEPMFYRTEDISAFRARRSEEHGIWFIGIKKKHEMHFDAADHA